MRKAEMKANGLENRKLTASPQWSMFKRIKIDDNDFLPSPLLFLFFVLIMENVAQFWSIAMIAIWMTNEFGPELLLLFSSNNIMV
jgi:hypothetical protein